MFYVLRRQESPLWCLQVTLVQRHGRGATNVEALANAGAYEYDHRQGTVHVLVVEILNACPEDRQRE